jgi:hypothetical protein
MKMNTGASLRRARYMSQSLDLIRAIGDALGLANTMAREFADRCLIVVEEDRRTFIRHRTLS